jgi:hypothetical protein
VAIDRCPTRDSDRPPRTPVARCPARHLTLRRGARRPPTRQAGTSSGPRREVPGTGYVRRLRGSAWSVWGSALLPDGLAPPCCRSSGGALNCSLVLLLGRKQILRHRRAVAPLDRRLPAGPDGLRRAAWAGLQDSMPRAALLSIHARVDGITSGSWEDPGLVQVWGPRFSVFVVAGVDLALFTVALLPDDARGRERAERLAAQLHDLLAEGVDSLEEASRRARVHPNAFRYAAATGTLLIRWDGARRPRISACPPPGMDPGDARLELGRRYLHVFAPTTAASFARWSGLSASSSEAVFSALRSSLVPVSTPIGGAWALASDEASLRSEARPEAAVRFLPSGDAYFLLQGSERELLVPDTDRRVQLWTPRVWPGALLLDGEVAGTWRRAGRRIRVQAWRELSAAERERIAEEVTTLPLPEPSPATVELTA